MAALEQLMEVTSDVLGWDIVKRRRVTAKLERLGIASATDCLLSSQQPVLSEKAMAIARIQARVERRLPRPKLSS